MTAKERQLEEDEAKLDNILHKIIVCAEKLDMVAGEIGSDAERNQVVKQKFHLLSGTISNLAMLADEVTLHEEKITVELEEQITGQLNSAINNIKEVQDFFEDPD